MTSALSISAAYPPVRPADFPAPPLVTSPNPELNPTDALLLRIEAGRSGGAPPIDLRLTSLSPLSVGEGHVQFHPLQER